MNLKTTIDRLAAKQGTLRSTAPNHFLMPKSMTYSGPYSTRAGRREMARMVAKAERKGAGK